MQKVQRMDVNTDKIQKGEYLSEVQYYEVLAIGRNTQTGEKQVKVRNQRGLEFFIDAGIVAEGMFSGVQFTTTEKVSQTRAAEILTEAGDTIFTVNFIKQSGEERTLTGYRLNSENLLGRSNVIDLAVTTGHNQRQIDHRTINWIILKNTKYVVK